MFDASTRTFLFSYRYNGSEWSLEIPAESAREARERLSAMSFARMDGELIAKFPVATGPIVRLTVWLKNILLSK